MALELQHAHSTGPFRWKLFLLIITIMGSITAGAIILTLMAHPSKGGVHAPAPEPVSRTISANITTA
ncbi:hypothetical protein [Granulicella arctica]|uniref:hypothetical protein n=1 Tax=Granulicella arctica TaxID=940613 RepID=UPI0021E018CE|nr:hypothetical protein [Granulicella arctica]